MAPHRTGPLSSGQVLPVLLTSQEFLPDQSVAVAACLPMGEKVNSQKDQNFLGPVKIVEPRLCENLDLIQFQVIV